MVLTKEFKEFDVYDILGDLQRVENNCKILKNRILTICGVDLPLSLKEDWTREDIPTIEEMERIRGNCERLAKVLDDKISIPIFHENFSYLQANQLEIALKTTDELLQKLITLLDRPRAGFYYASEPLVLITERKG